MSGKERGTAGEVGGGQEREKERRKVRKERRGEGEHDLTQCLALSPALKACTPHGAF